MEQRWDGNVASEMSRRLCLGLSASALATMAAGRLLAEEGRMVPVDGGSAVPGSALAGASGHPAQRAKRIIYLFQSGAPSQMDLFDPKPTLEARRGENLPDSIRQGQRLTTMTSGQSTFPVAPSIFRFAEHGKSGMWFSDLLPHMAGQADRFCMIR